MALLKVVLGECHTALDKLSLQIDHVEVMLKPHPLCGLMPLPQKFFVTAITSLNCPGPSPGAIPLGALPVATGLPVLQLFAIISDKLSCTE